MTTKKNLAIISLFAMACWVLLFFVLAAPSCAFAQDTVALSATDLGTGPSDAEVKFITALGDQLWFAIVNREWWMLASLIVTGLTWAWRMQLVDRFWKDSAFDRFCDHPVVAAVTPGVLATIGGLAAGMAGTGPFAVDVLLANVVKVWAGSVAGFILVKKVSEAKKPAPEATP